MTIYPACVGIKIFTIVDQISTNFHSNKTPYPTTFISSPLLFDSLITEKFSVGKNIQISQVVFPFDYSRKHFISLLTNFFQKKIFLFSFWGHKSFWVKLARKVGQDWVWIFGAPPGRDLMYSLGYKEGFENGVLNKKMALLWLVQANLMIAMLLAIEHSSTYHFWISEHYSHSFFFCYYILILLFLCTLPTVMLVKKL